MAQRPRDLGTPIDRNLALELVRVTEGAAMSAARHMGRNQKETADQAAVDSMRRSLGFVDMDGDVVIRGGTLIDGSGAPGRMADVAVRDGRIAAIGDNLTGSTELDAAGQVVKRLQQGQR